MEKNVTQGLSAVSGNGRNSTPFEADHHCMRQGQGERNHECRRGEKNIAISRERRNRQRQKKIAQRSRSPCNL